MNECQSCLEANVDQIVGDDGLASKQAKACSSAHSKTLSTQR
jgi:hypothetical protein